jgi:hypothetical protein
MVLVEVAVMEAAECAGQIAQSCVAEKLSSKGLALATPKAKDMPL